MKSLHVASCVQLTFHNSIRSTIISGPRVSSLTTGLQRKIPMAPGIPCIADLRVPSKPEENIAVDSLPEMDPQDEDQLANKGEIQTVP